MRKSGFGIFLIAALFVSHASAADLPLPFKASPAPEPAAINWTGFYIGGQGGGGWGSSSSTQNAFFFCPAGGVCAAPTPFSAPAFSTSSAGALGGVTAGFNYQFKNPIIIGIEADWSAAAINGSGACNRAFAVGNFGGGATGTCSSNLQDFATITGRLGWAWERALFYVKGGGAFARYNDTITTIVAGIPGPAANFTNDRSGWTLGVGAEYAFSPGWSFKVEYQHMDFGIQNVTYPFVNVPPFAAGVFNTINSETQHVDIVRAGINYRFNWWPALITE